jgi:preprotein translocase subunit SecA
MMDGIKEEAVGFLYYVQVNVEELSATDAAEGGEVAPIDAAAASEPVAAAAAAAAAAAVSDSAAAAPLVGETVPPAAANAPVNVEKQSVSDVIGKAIGAPAHAPAANLQYSAPSVDGEGGVERSSDSAAAAGGGGGSFANASRNAPCPCGSGRKYKRCHGAPATPAS